MERDPRTQGVIGAAIEVHRHLGPGLLESVYERCLSVELSRRGIPYLRQVRLPVRYHGVEIDCAFRIDLLVEESVVVEVKSIETILPVHKAQLLTYLKLSGLGVGLIINFNEALLRDGIVRLVN